MGWRLHGDEWTENTEVRGLRAEDVYALTCVSGEQKARSDTLGSARVNQAIVLASQDQE